MSKNFELLQRMEEERHKSPLLLVRDSAALEDLNIEDLNIEDLNAEDLRADDLNTQNPEAEDQEAVGTQVKSPTESLPSVTRNQLESMMRKISSTPALRVLTFCGVDTDSDACLITACEAELLSRTNAGSVCVFDASSVGDGFADLFEPEKPVENPDRALLYTRIDENLWMASRDTAPHSASSSLGLADLIAELRNNFNRVLVHADPAALSTETEAIGQLSDGLIMVIEAELTARDLTQQVKAEFESANIKVFGAVLNNCHSRIPPRLNDWLRSL